MSVSESSCDKFNLNKIICLGISLVIWKKKITDTT